MSLDDDVAKYYAARAEEYDLSAGYMDSLAEEQRASIKTRFQRAFKGHDVLEIACGTGYWTEVISVTAHSVLATDIDRGMISIARKRLSSISNVRCQIADAYSLEGVTGPFSAAFSHWWWSHIPTSRIRSFLVVLHSKLIPGAFVLFADQLTYECQNRRRDEEGNLLEERILRNARRFKVVKNFPTEGDIIRHLAGLAERVTYNEYPEGGYWAVTYNTGKDR